MPMASFYLGIKAQPKGKRLTLDIRNYKGAILDIRNCKRTLSFMVWIKKDLLSYVTLLISDLKQ